MLLSIRECVIWYDKAKELYSPDSDMDYSFLSCGGDNATELERLCFELSWVMAARAWNLSHGLDQWDTLACAPEDVPRVEAAVAARVSAYANRSH